MRHKAGACKASYTFYSTVGNASALSQVREKPDWVGSCREVGGQLQGKQARSVTPAPVRAALETWPSSPE